MKPLNVNGIAVEVKDLAAVLGGVKVIDIPSFQVRSGEILIIMGPNGSGKTTLLMSLALLVKQVEGRIIYGGVPVANPKQVLETRRNISVLFQESLLLGGTVWDNVMLGLRLRGVTKEDAKPRITKWLERFGILDLAKRQALTLSGGEAKRVSLARAFVLDPGVIYLDEPFTALDSPTRQALLEDFEEVLRETGVTTVMVTHERNEALALADRIAVIMEGKIVQTGPPDEIFSSPANEEIANFVEAGNVLHGEVKEINEGLAMVRVGRAAVDACCELPVGNKVILLVPYDDVTVLLAAPDDKTTSARNRFPGKITRIFPAGSQIRVTIDCGEFSLTALITRRSLEEMGLIEGLNVIATVKATSIRVIGRH